MKDNTKKSFIQLAIIYILAVINGSLWYIIFKNSLYVIVFVLTIIIGINIYLKRNHIHPKIWLKKPNKEAKKPIIISSLIILFLMFLGLLMSKNTIFKFDISIFISLCLLSPLIEKIACRGIIIDLLKKRHDTKHIIISAIMRLKSERIIPSLIWHFIWNNFIYFLPLLTQSILYSQIY